MWWILSIISNQTWHKRLNRFYQHLLGFIGTPKLGKWKKNHHRRSLSRNGVTLPANLCLSMTEQRDINHLTAVVVSQSCSEASARDTHPLWLKDWNQHVKSPNVSRTGTEQEEGEGVCEECACVRERERERFRMRQWRKRWSSYSPSGNIGAERVLWRAMGCEDSTVADEKLAFYQT